MQKRGVAEWTSQPEIRRILLAFAVPKTPGYVEKELAIKKLKLKPFLEKHLLKPLNPEARKGRFYTLTSSARRLLKLPALKRGNREDWHLRGFVDSSPRQRLVILRTVDSKKRTSEEIRRRATELNPCLSRPSTKRILKELVSECLVRTEMIDRGRYYWITERGAKLKTQLEL